MRRLAIAVFGPFFAVSVISAAEADPRAPTAHPWALTAYGAVLSTAAFETTITSPGHFDRSYRLVALALARELSAPDRHLQIEAEGQLVRHAGAQHHTEINGLLSFRWRTFPWNRWLPTTAAFGAGLSWASEIPPFEAQLHDETHNLLMYLLIEGTVSIPRAPRWAAVYRVHHRSGAYGIFDSVHGGSNAVGLGIKWRF